MLTPRDGGRYGARAMKAARISIAAVAVLVLVTQSVAFASDKLVCPMTGREMVGCADDFAPPADAAAVERSCCCELRQGHPITPPVAIRDGAVQVHAVTAACLPSLVPDAPILSEAHVTAPRDAERPPGRPRYLTLRQLLI